jgi:hypothetical protein
MAYQPIQMPQPEGLGGFAEFLMHVAQQNKADDARRAELLLRQQSAQDEMRHRQVLEQHAGQQLKIQQDQANEAIAVKRLEATKQITAALDSGRPDLAKQIANTFGIPFEEKKNDPRDALMKPSFETPGQPVEYGPRSTPEIDANAARLRGVATDNVSLYGDYPGMMDRGNIDITHRPRAQNPDGSVSTVRSMSFQEKPGGPEILIPTVSDDGRILSEDEAISLYQKTGRHLGKFGAPGEATSYAMALHEQQEGAVPRDGERSRFAFAQQGGTQYEFGGFQPQRQKFTLAGKEYDPQQTRDAADERRTRSTQRFATAMGDVQGLEKYIPIYTSGVEAGLEPEKAFELMQKRMQSDDERAARDETARLQREQSDTNNRRIAAAMGSRVTHDDPFKQRTADRGDETSLDTVTKNVFGQLGFKEQQVANRKFNDMAATASKGNAGLDAVTAGSFVKMAQGGTGVISDSDMEQFWNRIGGVKERSAQWVENVVSGKIATDKRTIVIQAVKELAARAKSNLDGIKDAVKYRLENSAFADRAPDVIGTYFPGERSAIEESRAIDRAKNRTRATRIKGGGRDALDAELDNL